MDYKEDFHAEHERELCDFGKDVLAIKNVGGGYILVGVKDKTWEAVGLSTVLPYDSRMLREKVQKCTGVQLDVDIVHHSIQGCAGGLLTSWICDGMMRDGKTEDGKRKTENGRRKTEDGKRKTENGRRVP